MFEKIAILFLVLLSDAIGLFRRQQTFIPIQDESCPTQFHRQHLEQFNTTHYSNHFFPLIAEAKGVAGLGKAGGDSQGGSDKAGQQVPPEVYNALSYAGSIFLLILSVPFVCFGLNKLLNKIEDCFGCGPSSKRQAPPTVKNNKQEQFGNQPKEKQNSPGEPNRVHPKNENMLYRNQQYQQQLRSQAQKQDSQLIQYDTSYGFTPPSSNHTADQKHQRVSPMAPGGTVRLPPPHQHQHESNHQASESLSSRTVKEGQQHQQYITYPPFVDPTCTI